MTNTTPQPQQAPKAPAEQPAQPTMPVAPGTPPTSIMNEPEVQKVSMMEKIKGLFANKGLVIGVIAVVVAVVIGVSVLFGHNAADQYQGLIKQIEQDTATLQAN